MLKRQIHYTGSVSIVYLRASSEFREIVNTCVVPGCSSRSDREQHLSFHALPLPNKPLLKHWVHQIGRKNLPLNYNSRVCSRHFKNPHGRILRHDEYPTENLPQLPTQVSTSTPRRSLLRRCAPDQHKNSDKQQECLQLQDIRVNTDTDEEVSVLTSRVAQLEREVSILRMLK